MHIPLGLCVVGAQAMCYNYKMNPTKFLATNAMDQMDGSGGGADLGSARFNMHQKSHLNCLCIHVKVFLSLFLARTLFACRNVRSFKRSFMLTVLTLCVSMKSWQSNCKHSKTTI